MTNLKGLETNLNDSIIVLDTNVISDIFEASPDYYNFIINCLDKVKDNVYLTDTIFHELSSIKDRPYRVPTFIEQKSSFLKRIQSHIGEELREIKKFKKYEDALTDVTIIDEIITEIENKEILIKDMLEKIVTSKLIEPALSNVDKNFVKELINSIQKNGKIGASLKRETLEKVSYQVEKRGSFPDKNKKGIKKFNDYFIVEEMKILAKTRKNDVLFITSDVKGNFQEEKLAEEFKSTTGYEFRIKSVNDFYSEIATLFNISQENITELFLSENKFDFLEELRNYSELEQIIIDYLLYSDVDGENEELEYLDIDFYDIEIDSSNDNEVSYIVTGGVDAEKVFYDYWGRDDDTKEIITSPANYKSYSGDIKLFVNRSFDVEGDIVRTNDIDCEIMDTSALEAEINTWGEDDL
ncbi:PIN-like domain-containing protein [Streptococcus salivarius]|uniref:PIN-like domain-containing protein n=1 Tax=Streptococcus salivarius TaxID=1304 RepID=UPI001583CBA9|nr:PIN-like domain-containing protein [Streptococcus salivarius]